MGKARLAPIKAATIPRLELTAATVSVRLSEILKKELDEKLDIIQYHTDSITVLRYISNDPNFARHLFYFTGHYL